MSALSFEARLGLLKQALIEIAGSRRSLTALADYLYKSKETTRIQNVNKADSTQQSTATQKVYNPAYRFFNSRT